MGKAYVPKWERVLISEREHRKLHKRGWLTLGQDQLVTAAYVVYEIAGLGDSRVIGVVTDRLHLRHLLKRADTVYAKENISVRIKDLMELKELCRRTGRSKATICGGWMKREDFPKPVKKFGNSPVYLWPEVQEWMEKHNLHVNRKEGE